MSVSKSPGEYLDTLLASGKRLLRKRSVRGLWAALKAAPGHFKDDYVSARDVVMNVDKFGVTMTVNVAEWIYCGKVVATDFKSEAHARKTLDFSTDEEGLVYVQGIEVGIPASEIEIRTISKEL